MSLQDQIDRLIAYQAAQWYELLKNGMEPGKKARIGFIGWVTESPRHMEAFLSIAASASFIRRAFTQHHHDIQQLLLDSDAKIAAWPVADARPQAEKARSRFLRQPGNRWRAAAAGVAAACVLAAGAMIWSSRPDTEYFETSTGEQRTLQLEEGSIVNLNAQTRIAVRIEDSRREIILEQGEATFKVAPDAGRPFTVHVHDATVRAVGTQFNVYARHNGVITVAVLEGKVRVSSDEAPRSRDQSQAVALTVGEVANIQPGGEIVQQKDADAADAIAWQQRTLIFKRTALEDIVAEFNRYNKSIRFTLRNISPGALRFTGVFSADDPQSLADLLTREPDLDVRRHQGEIIISGTADHQP